jgi:DNA repair protein RadC
MKQQPLRLVAPENRLACLAPADLTEPESTILIALAVQVLAARHRPGCALTSPDDTRAYLQLLFAERPNEVQGTIDGASVHPREVVRRALECRAGAVIVAHCHPSGVAEPSQADLRITERLKSALALVDVRVLDHVIVVATEGTVSFAERGLL